MKGEDTSNYEEPDNELVKPIDVLCVNEWTAGGPWWDQVKWLLVVPDT